MTRNIIFLILFASAAVNVSAKTAPASTFPDQTITRIAHGSCIDQREPQPIWEPVAAWRPQVFIFTGDIIYSDTPDAEKKRRGYKTQNMNPVFKEMRKTCYVTGTWDDHDFGMNDIGKYYPARELSRDILLEFFKVPTNSPRYLQEGIFHAEIFGPPGRRVQILNLDTRWFRDNLLKSPKKRPAFIGPYIENMDPAATILGEAQWKWLGKELAKKADLRILVSSIQLISKAHYFERWENMPLEKDRLFNLIKETKANGVIVISGDRHHGEINLIKDAVGYPLYEITSSGLNKGRPSGEEPNEHRLGEICWSNNFGTIEIDWESKPPNVTFGLTDVHGKEFNSISVPLDELQPR